MIEPLPDLQAVARLGERISARLQPGDVVALSGELGTGKTTLSRAILRALGHEGDVPSPTYTILETYDLPGGSVIHADFYRLEHAAQAEELGLDDYRDGAVLLAEWPDRAGGFDEAACLSIQLKNEDGTRSAIVEGGADWQRRMP